MANTAWRCSQCGTVNEPDARACHSCGKWASLFDLQDGAVEEADLEEEFHVPEFDLEEFEPETFEPERDTSVEPEPDGARRRRLLRSLVVPLALLVYLVVSLLSDR
ncbi:MAG: hypothetical protein A2Y55_04005 [Actinobacteria bacterium RBG_16_68_12]|nr:MAG: hypothetical protein A2Y55_04005 [Actinobacteria bacterium RBG_16_68_12]